MQDYFEELITLLTKAGVEFAIVGGVSAILQGVPVTTRDLDLCYRRTPDNIARLVSALSPMNPRPRGFPPDLPFTFDARAIQLGSNFTLTIGDEELDLLGEMSGIGGYEQIIAQTDDMPVADCKVKVLRLAELIRTKEAAGRPKDLAVLPLLRATLELQRQQDLRPDDSTAPP